MAAVTRASIFAEAGKRTPLFTVAGERGSSDTPHDVRGFAVKFYTDEGNWDLVGNNMPVFFIQDAIKFPDLIHALKPEPHNGIPQAASAHDTFWDFVSLMPESTHMLMWVMSDRALPRSYRMMQGFGVHTFRLVNAEGKSTFVKFHWRPVAGTHCLDWDELVKLCGADADWQRRDLWEAIEAGAFPEDSRRTAESSAPKLLARVGNTAEFLKHQYRHAKAILALGAGAERVDQAGAPAKLPSGKQDPGMLVGLHAGAKQALPDFVKAIARHRHFERAMDPPAV